MHPAAMRLVLLGLGLSLLLASCAKHSGGQTGDEDALPSGDEFFGELGKRGGFGNYQPATSLDELVDWSGRVVVGRPIALRAGRSFVIGSNDAIHTVVLELAVERTLKGADAAALYLEFIVGDAETIAPDRLPDARVIAFAKRAGRELLGGSSIEGEGRGLPPGETLHQLTNPQGLAVEREDGVSNAFEPGNDGLFGDTSLDDLIARVAASVQRPDAGRADGGAAGESDAGTAGSGGSAAGSTAPVPDAGGCPGELPFEPGSPPRACPAGCEELRGSPFDETSACVDYANQIIIGCTEGVGPPVVVCVERPNDGKRFQVGAGWPFPMSTTYRTCSDDDSTAVLSAPACE